MGLTFLLIGIYIIVWAILIDLACKYKRQTSAWFMVALASVIATSKINWIKRINSSINNNLMGDDDEVDEIYEDANLWNSNNWNSFFISGERVPGYPNLIHNFDKDNLYNAFILDNPLPQLPLPGPPSYGPEMRFTFSQNYMDN